MGCYLGPIQAKKGEVMNYEYPLDYRLDGLGAELTDATGRSIYLQGEDADAIRGLDEWLDTVEEWPYGPYDTPQDAINAVLDDYFACLD